MKWPWVSRHAVDAYEGSHVVLIARVHAAERRYDDLLVKYHDLVASLMVPSQAIGSRLDYVPAPVTLREDAAAVIAESLREPDPIAQTIREQAGRDVHLANHLRKYSRELKGQGLNTDEIVGKLVQWQTSEQEDHAATM